MSRVHNLLTCLALSLTLLSLQGADADSASKGRAQAVGFDAGEDAAAVRVDAGAGVAADGGSRELARDAQTDALVTPTRRDAGADARRPASDADSDDDASVSMAEPVKAALEAST